MKPFIVYSYVIPKMEFLVRFGSKLPKVSVSFKTRNVGFKDHSRSMAMSPFLRWSGLSIRDQKNRLHLLSAIKVIGEW